MIGRGARTLGYVNQGLREIALCNDFTGPGWLRKSFKIRERCSVLGLISWAGIDLTD